MPAAPGPRRWFRGRSRSRTRFGARFLDGLLKAGLFLGGAAFVTGLVLVPGDRDLTHLAQRLSDSGVPSTGRGAEIWRACTHKGCTDSDHARAVVALPGGDQKVLLRGSSTVTDDLPEEKWSPATAETGYAGTVDVLFDATAPADTVMAVSDVHSWIAGDYRDSVTEDIAVAVIGAVIAVLSGLWLAWRAGVRPGKLWTNGKHKAVAG